MKQIFEYKRKYNGLEEITEILGETLKKTILIQNEVLTIGRKIFVKGGSLNAEISFDTNTTHGEYSVIDIKVFNLNSQIKGNSLRIMLTDQKYGYDPNLKGGYFWTYDNSWYGHIPDFNLVMKHIKDFIKFVEIS